MKNLLKYWIVGASFMCCVNAFAEGSRAGAGGVDADRATSLAMPNDGMDATQAMAICQSIDQAFASNDVNLLSQLIGDGATHTNPMGAALSKADFLDNIQAGKVRFNTYKTKSVDFVEQVGMTLVVGGVLEASATCNNKPFAGDFRFVRILVPSGEMRWQQIYSQLTPVAPINRRATAIHCCDHTKFINPMNTVSPAALGGRSSF